MRGTREGAWEGWAAPLPGATPGGCGSGAGLLHPELLCKRPRVLRAVLGW
jgi:hypothetical protein